MLERKAKILPGRQIRQNRMYCQFALLLNKVKSVNIAASSPPIGISDEADSKLNPYYFRKKPNFLLKRFATALCVHE